MRLHSAGRAALLRRLLLPAARVAAPPTLLASRAAAAAPPPAAGDAAVMAPMAQTAPAVENYSYAEAPERAAAAAALVGRAFSADPGNELFAAPGADRAERWRLIALGSLRRQRDVHQIFEIPGAVALAYTVSPEPPPAAGGSGDEPEAAPAPTPEEAADAAALEAMTRLESLPVRDALLAALDAREAAYAAAHGAFLYLAFLAVEPQQQGRGLGSVLLRHLMQRADAEGIHLYLAATTEDNRRLYARHGFLDDAHDAWRCDAVPGALVQLFFMGRPPRRE